MGEIGNMGKPMWIKWANDHDAAQLQMKKLPEKTSAGLPSMGQVGKRLW